MKGASERRHDSARPKPLRKRDALARQVAPARRGRQMMRQWRILSTLDGLHRGLTVAEIRQAIEDGSDRTIFRDIEHLRASGFNLISDEGRWRLIGRRPDTVRVTPADVVALMTLEQAVPAHGGGWALDHVRQLRKQLAAELTPQGRGLVQELGTLNAVTLPQPNQALLRFDDAIDEAINKQHVLRIRYRSPDKPESERDVEPYSLWLAAFRPYLIARCRKAGGVRTFHRARITGAEVLDEPFEPDPDFDLAAFVREKFGVHSGEVLHVQLELAPEIAHIASERRIHSSQRVEERDGRTLLSFSAAGLSEMAAWVASFGGMMRVVGPEALRDAVRRLHEEGLRLHEEGLRLHEEGLRPHEEGLRPHEDADCPKVSTGVAR